MREIKFEITLKDLGVDKDIIKIYPTIESLITHPIDLDAWEVVRIREFTGLKDKNGKEIYEGDIVKGMRGIDGFKYTGRIVYDKPNFELYIKKIASYLQDYHVYDMEVIGNIYENPELLKSNEV